MFCQSLEQHAQTFTLTHILQDKKKRKHLCYGIIKPNNIKYILEGNLKFLNDLKYKDAYILTKIRHVVGSTGVFSKYL